MKYIVIISIATCLAGCVGTRITKEIEVHRDAQGKIIKTVETETATQNGMMKPFKFNTFKCERGDNESPTIYH
jgi:hypothetical protein